MTSFAAKMVAKKVFGETAANKQGQEDPYFETVPTRRLGFINTTKKQKRSLPPGLTPEEEAILVKAKRRAHRIDLSLGSLCGIKFGWGAVIGLVPGVGDVADFLLAYMVFKTCCSIDPPLPANKRATMTMNMAIDFAIGLIPFIGDVMDAAYKCNTKNVIILEDVLRERGAARLKGTPQEGSHDPSLGLEEERMIARNGPPPTYATQPDLERGDAAVQQPQAARGR